MTTHAMKYLLLLFCAIACGHSSGQNHDPVIMEPIEMLFAGMNRGDSALVRKAFTGSPVMATVHENPTAGSAIRFNDFHKFLMAVGARHAEPWSELIWDVQIESDGNLAQVWAKYAFYVGRKFSHCGVDAFQLIKDTDRKWRIFFYRRYPKGRTLRCALFH